MGSDDKLDNARWGDKAILQVTRGRSELDPGSDDAAQFVGAYLSSYPETGAHDC